VDGTPTPAQDPLAEPVRARLFRALGALRRPAGTQELADLVERHPNTVRLNLQRLADAGLIERRTTRQVRGRPRDEWAVHAGARPGGDSPQAHGDLARWLARVLATTGELEDVERTGREIGHELAPEPLQRSPAATMQDALTALGFSPRAERTDQDRVRYVLANCPYRDAVRENQPTVCTLHRGITRGLLDRLAPDGELERFVARDPYTAGCVIDVLGVPAGD
jgi:predicted ArsR family transcriptional regulator